jgi:hypothetical protein
LPGNDASLHYEVSVEDGDTITGKDFGNHFALIIGPCTNNGSISGTVYNELNDETGFGEGDQGLAGWTLYLDTNDNGQLDSGELTTVSQAGGFYSFTGLAAGTYIVREAVANNWTLVDPSEGSYTVTLTCVGLDLPLFELSVSAVGGNTATGLNFGNTANPGGGGSGGTGGGGGGTTPTPPDTTTPGTTPGDVAGDQDQDTGTTPDAGNPNEAVKGDQDPGLPPTGGELILLSTVLSAAAALKAMKKN